MGLVMVGSKSPEAIDDMVKVCHSSCALPPSVYLSVSVCLLIGLSVCLSVCLFTSDNTLQ